ncbi:hypothetical protein [Moraxella sp. Pampa]|uniref:hypothetical protein n=1 Tax=Moraxella sp. Pampa TaxID=3111978 RepID=UPI002B417B4C|nr:hypothetical protein [Moraxella sp. Pampa]
MVDISRIDLGALDKENLEKVKLMLDISKIQADIEMTRQSVGKNQVDIESIRQSIAESQASVEQMKANTAKMQKEMAWFPYLQIITTILTGGVVVFLLTKLLQ